MHTDFDGWGTDNFAVTRALALSENICEHLHASAANISSVTAPFWKGNDTHGIDRRRTRV